MAYGKPLRSRQSTIQDFLIGSTKTRKSPPAGSRRHSNLSPASKPNCSTSHAGTVARKDGEPGFAFVNTVSLPVMGKDMHGDIYKSTSESTNKFIYTGAYRGRYRGRKVVSVTVHNPKQLRALAILSGGKDAIKRIDPNHYQVKSQHGEHYYDVSYKHGAGWQCTCPNFAEHHGDCKHIYAAHFSAKLRLDIEREVETNPLHIPEAISCPACKGYHVVKNAKRKTKKGVVQRYKCEGCGHRFVTDRTFSRLKATPDIVCVSMDLYFKGNSLAKIKHHLKMFYKCKVSRPTVLRWIHRFSAILNDYSAKHKPQVGDLWNSDEMTINVRKKGIKRNLEWIWNLMDSETRFLLASTVTHDRYVKDAAKVLTQGRKRAGRRPKALITDGLKSYPKANWKANYSMKEQTTHFRTPSTRKYFLNQNIERLNGTVRERLKVMRGVHSIPTAQALLDGERFYYNHIKPHMSLDGMTPAQVAGVPTPGMDENPWLAYILAATREQATV